MKQKFIWTEEKEKELISLWNTKSLYKIATDFHTTPENLIEKAKELELPAYKSDRWTKEEEEKLREYSKKYVTKTIAKKLNRSYIAVQKKAVKLGIELRSTPDPWKKWMVEYLKENINQKSIGEIESVIGLSYYQIISKCKELGIEYKKTLWTEEEIAILREYAPKCHYTELVKVLPGRSIGAITAKAYELEIETISEYVKLNEEQIEYIKKYWGKKHATEIARNLKISTGVLYRYKKELELPDIGQQIKWNEEKIEKLRLLAKTKYISELAEIFKTSNSQISRIASKNNIELLDKKKVWNDQLEEELIKLVKENLSIKEISEKMNLKANIIRTKIKKLGLTNDILVKEEIWTEEKIEELLRLVDTNSIDEIANIIGVSRNQVSKKLKELNIYKKNNRFWTEEDSEKLISLKEYDVFMICKIMNKSEATIKEKAKVLGITLKNPPKKRWIKEEEEKLIEYAKNYTINEIAEILEMLPSTVSNKLKYMGVSAQKSSIFWTEEDVEKLKEYAKEYTIEEIAKKIERTYGVVANKLNDLNISAVNKSNRAWTKEEDELLISMLSDYSTFEISKKLNRSEESVHVRAGKLGYDLQLKHKAWTEEEEELLSDLWGNKSIEYIAKKLNRSTSAIMNRVSKLGLGSHTENNYDGIKIQEIADIFNVDRNTILVNWVALGLKIKVKNISKNRSYATVTIENLFKFLEQNQNIWDSRNLEENLFGIEPEWLKEKRKSDIENNFIPERINLKKHQLISAKNFYVEKEKVKMKQKGK
ncbi:MAG: hypothetical protein E7157_05390 [Lactobacillales bacterium]|nr:hypothetical protein [Lactobacillales bacterium]